MASILNSALTGDADFAGAVFGQQSPEPQPTETPQEAVVSTPEPTAPEPTKEQSTPEKTKAPVPAESKGDKKPKVSKEEAAKTVADVTKKVSSSDTNAQSSEADSDSDLPVNPHFDDKTIADKPEGDDSEKGVASWREIKSEMRKAREDRDRLKAELDAAKEAGSKISTQEVDTLKQQLEEYKVRMSEIDRELRAANFERSPAYVESVRKPLNSLQADVKAIADVNGADYGKLWNALAEPDVRKRAEALDDLTGDFKRMEQLSIIKMADKYHDLYEKHLSMEKESLILNDEASARKAREDQEFIENDQRLQKAFTTKAWTSFEDKHSFLKEIEGHDDWNTYLRNARKMAFETNLDRLSVEDRSNIVAKASVVPFLESAINHYATKFERAVSEKDAKIKELQQQVDSFVKATPSLGTSAAEVDSDDEDSDSGSLTNFGASILGR
jgi:hypothetical protein